MDSKIRIELKERSIWMYSLITLAVMTIVTYLSESTHVTEVNSLPNNRTELDGIHDIRFIALNKSLVVEFEYKFIYEVTLEQTLSLMNVKFSIPGATLVKYADSKYFVQERPHVYRLEFQSPFYGNVSASLYRSKSFLHNEIVEFDVQVSQGSSSSLQCSGSHASTLTCSLSNVCIIKNEVFIFSDLPIEADTPFFRSYGSDFSFSVRNKMSIDDFKKQMYILNDTLASVSILSFDSTTKDPWTLLNAFYLPMYFHMLTHYSNSTYIVTPNLEYKRDSLTTALLNNLSFVSSPFCTSNLYLYHKLPKSEDLMSFRSFVLQQIDSNQSDTPLYLTNSKEVDSLAHNLTSVYPNIEVVDISQCPSYDAISKLASSTKVIIDSPSAAPFCLFMKTGKIIELVGDKRISLSTVTDINRVEHLSFCLSTSKVLETELDTCGTPQTQPDLSQLKNLM